jgi:pimeloyl-ACP methyl ester carboxylesterase
MREYGALLIDFIGSGSSEWSPVFDYSMGSHAQVAACVLDHEGLSGNTVVGFSMGGTVGIRLALDRPDLVGNLIVAESNLAPGGGPLTRHITSFTEDEFIQGGLPAMLDDIRKAELEGDEESGYLRAGWSRADPKGFYRSARGLVELAHDFYNQYLQMEIPRTFIYGSEAYPTDQDQIGPDTPDPAVLKRHGIQVTVVPESGHAMMFDNLEGFVEVLKVAVETKV